MKDHIWLYYVDSLTFQQVLWILCTTLIVNVLLEYTYNISTKEIKNLKLLNHLDTPYSHQNSFSKENEIPDTFTMVKFTLYNISINLMHWSFTKKIFENGNQSFNFQFMHQWRGGNLDEITCLEINAANFTIGICVHFHIWAIEHLKLSWCIYGVWYSIKHVLINLIRLYL